MERVSVFACGEYARGPLDDCIERHFAALDPQGRLIFPGARVVVKPNLLLRRRPDEATTTHPEFLAAVIRAVMRRGGECVIAESPGGPHSKQNLRSVYSGTGMERVAEETGAELSYDMGVAEVPARNGAVSSRFKIIAPVAAADLVISVAKLKTHALMTTTGAVKNLFGCIPGLTKPEYHYRYPNAALFAKMIVDLCETVAPALSFIDGVVGMEGNGPSGGAPRFMGVTLASKNPYALDLAAAGLMGFAPEEIPIVKEAIARGLCPASLRELELVGDEYGSFTAADFKKPQTREVDALVRLPSFLHGPLEALLAPRPAVRRRECVGCGKCAESCPRDAIRIENGKAAIDRQKCIRCYCCQEMCPRKAVAVRRLGIFRS